MAPWPLPSCWMPRSGSVGRAAAGSKRARRSRLHSIREAAALVEDRHDW
jgi:hypothetical protein